MDVGELPTGRVCYLIDTDSGPAMLGQQVLAEAQYVKTDVQPFLPF